MSTEQQPDTPPLTRRQLRELRNTGATPIIAEGMPAPAAPPPRAAEPVDIAPAPADIDPDAVPLTRRQARLIERVRTASVPVITAEVAAAEAARQAEEAERAAAEEAERAAAEAEQVAAEEAERVAAEEAKRAAAEAERTAAEEAERAAAEEAERVAAEETEWAAADEAEPVVSEEAAEPEQAGEAETDVADEAEAPAPREEDVAAEPDDADDEQPASEAGLQVDLADLWGPPVPASEALAGDEPELVPHEAAAAEPDDSRPLIAEGFGAELLAGDGVELSLPASFDELLTRDATMTGSSSAPSALILSQSPDTTTFDSPITATGEVIVTGTLSFPESFGATGVVRGSSDGEEVDALLVDREIPAASSPTPIAASSAVSTIKSADEIIQPPAPEKGGRLMMVLAITAGALALALAGVLILGFVSGIFG